MVEVEKTFSLLSNCAIKHAVIKFYDRIKLWPSNLLCVSHLVNVKKLSHPV